MRSALICLLLSGLGLVAQPALNRNINTVGGLTISLVGSNASTTAAATYTCLSPYQPKQNSLLLALVVNSKASLPDIPTGSGHALTYTQIRTTNYFSLGTPLSRLTVFYAHSKSGATTNAFTASFSGVNQTGCIVQEIEITNSDNAGPGATNALVQIVHNGANANTNATVTFAAFGGTRELAIMFGGGSLNSAVMAAEAGWTKLADQNYNNPAVEGYIIYQLRATDTTPLATNATSMSHAEVGVEVGQRGAR